MSETTMEQVAAELGIDLTSPEPTEAEAEQHRVDILRAALKGASSDVAVREGAIRALKAVGHAELFASSFAALDQLKEQASRELGDLRRDFIDTRLVPLAEAALPQTRYPWLYAMSTVSAYDAASGKMWLGTYSRWCDENPAHVDPWTVADLSNPNTLRDGELCEITTIYQLDARTLVDIETYLAKRLASRRASTAKQEAKKARQKALKAVNRARKGEGLAPLPDPDTKAGRDEIRKLEAEASRYSFNNLMRDSVKQQSPEQTAAHEAEHARLVAIANEAVYGNAAGEPPHELYLTGHQIACMR